jgi:hypothetical protein
MRALILVAGAALGLAACGNNDQTDTAMNADDNLTAENIVANDVTAIDAVTADAANMAADVDINFTNEQLGSTGNGSAGRAPDRPSQARTRSATAPQSQPATNTPAPSEPATNTATNSTE